MAAGMNLLRVNAAHERRVDHVGVARRERQRPFVVGRAQRQIELGVGQVDALLASQPEPATRRVGDAHHHVRRPWPI